MRTRTGVLAGAFLLAAAAAQPVSAQAVDVDSRWQAFLGCWAPFVQDGSQPVADHVVCFRPASGGVDVLMASTAYGGSSQITDLLSEASSGRLRKHTFDVQGTASVEQSVSGCLEARAADVARLILDFPEGAVPAILQRFYASC